MTFQKRYLGLLDENGPDEVDAILGKLYARLGNHQRWLAAVEAHPEYAGLLAGSLDVDPQGPDLILDSLEQAADHEVATATLYQIGPRPEEAVRTARLFQEEGTLIARLAERTASRLIGFLQPEALPRNAEASRIYRRWVRRLAERGLSSSDERLDRVQTILLLHGSTVSARLDDDPDFRRRFQEEIAPLAESILLKDEWDELDWGVRSGSPAIWEFLQEYGAEGRDWCEAEGTVAIDLLTAPELRAVRKNAVDAVRLGDQETIEALRDEDLRSRPLFIKLLERDLPAGTRAKALANLRVDPPHAPSLLSYYDGLSNAALVREIGPPPEDAVTWLPGYSMYSLIDKMGDGRQVGKLEVAFAAIDGLETITLAKGASYGFKFVQKSVAKNLASRGAGVAARRAAEATERQLLPWLLKNTAAGTRAMIEQTSQAKAVDVTRAVRLAFEGSGVSRDSFRRFTGLEARIFMRGDRRVLIDFGASGARNHVLSRYLSETAFNGTVDTTLNGLQKTGVPARVLTQAEAWRAHVAAWWLAHATGSVDEIRAGGAGRAPKTEAPGS